MPRAAFRQLLPRSIRANRREIGAPRTAVAAFGSRKYAERKKITLETEEFVEIVKTSISAVATDRLSVIEQEDANRIPNGWMMLAAFSRWSYDSHILPVSIQGTPQSLLKHMLFSVPNFHRKDKNESSVRPMEGKAGSRFSKGAPQEEISANHMLAERKRRKKLNERFIILRSLLPSVTRMDKASILGDTVEYVKRLRRRIQELERQNKVGQSKPISVCNMSGGSPRDEVTPETSQSVSQTGEALSSTVHVSIIDADALLELQWPYREGLLLQIMHALNELKLEVTSVQSSLSNGIFAAELRAKVKYIDRKKANIVEVKKAIYQVLLK